MFNWMISVFGNDDKRLVNYICVSHCQIFVWSFWLLLSRFLFTMFCLCDNYGDYRLLILGRWWYCFILVCVVCIKKLCAGLNENTVLPECLYLLNWCIQTYFDSSGLCLCENDYFRICNIDEGEIFVFFTLVWYLVRFYRYLGVIWSGFILNPSSMWCSSVESD